tara:strand:- start:745 stop:1284 length:540 start_codon:yes stop_codon:yes gene_type:complete
MELITLGSEKIHYLLIFLFILLANFIGDVSSCSLRRFLNKNMIIKHIGSFITLLLFVTVELYEDSHVYEILLNTVMMYICFILLMRTYYIFTFIILGLIVISYLVTLHINYLEKNDESSDVIEYYNKLRDEIFIISFIMIIIGFIYNLVTLKMQYKEKFSLNKYIIGMTNEECFNPLSK